jgi:outer membrane protein assembly factor BamB
VDSVHAYFPGVDHDLTAVVKATGKVAWTARTNVVSARTRGFGAVAAGPVVVLCDDGLHAFDVTTGAPRWSFEGEGSQPGYSVPFFRDSVLYAGSFEGDVFALDSRDGRVIWRARSPTLLRSVSQHPFVEGDQVLVGYSNQAATSANGGGVAAFDAATGSLRWYVSLDSLIPNGMDRARVGFRLAATDSVVVAPTELGFVFALDRRSGQVQWVVPPRRPSGGEVRPVAVIQSTFLIMGFPGILDAYDAQTGQRLWERDTEVGGPSQGFTVDDSAVYIPTGGGQLVAIRSSDGAVLWQLGDGSSSLSLSNPPAVDERAVYAGGLSGFYAIRK